MNQAAYGTLMGAGDDFELYREEWTEMEVDCRGGAVTAARAEQGSATTLRLVRGGRLGSAVCLGPPDLTSLVADAVACAAWGQAFEPPFFAGGRPAPAAVGDSAVAGLAVGDMAGLATDTHGMLDALCPKERFLVSVKRRVTDISLETRSWCGAYRRTVLELVLESEQGLWVGARLSGVPTPGERRNLARELAARCGWAGREGRNAGAVKSARRGTDVLFAPSAVPFLLQPLVANLEGPAAVTGSSLLWPGPPWEFDRRVRLYEDGTLTDCCGSAPFDAEGVPTARNPLITDGRVRGLLLDGLSARRLSQSPNGTAQREEPGELPTPGHHNLELGSGDRSPASLLAGMQRGLYVFDLMLDGNATESRLSVQMGQGFAVRGGEVAGRVEDLLLSLDVFAVLGGGGFVLGSDRTVVTGSFVMPHLLVHDVVISG